MTATRFPWIPKEARASTGKFCRVPERKITRQIAGDLRFRMWRRSMRYPHTRWLTVFNFRKDGSFRLLTDEEMTEENFASLVLGGAENWDYEPAPMAAPGERPAATAVDAT